MRPAVSVGLVAAIVTSGSRSHGPAQPPAPRRSPLAGVRSRPAYAFAVELAVGVTTLALSGTTLERRPELAGTVEVDELVPIRIVHVPSQELAVTGTLQRRIVRSTGGTVDFYYRLTELRILRDDRGVEWLSTSDFGDVDCDVDVRNDGLGDVGPSFASRIHLTSPSGSRIDFRWSAPYLRQPSLFFFVKTDATTYDRSGLITIGTGEPSHGVEPFEGYRPISPSRMPTVRRTERRGTRPLRKR